MMRYTRVHLEAMGYELAPNVVSTRALEARLGPLYEKLNLKPGHLELLTGIRERRWWDAGHTNAAGAAAAARRALAAASFPADELEGLIYGGVCRDHLEPATACDVAAALGVSPSAEVYDVSNACLGVLNGLVEIANRIELGQIRAGMVVACESAREINEIMIDRMLADSTMDAFRLGLATLTGGSGAVALLLTDGRLRTRIPADPSGQAPPRPRLRGGFARTAPRHHALCRWEVDGCGPNNGGPFTATDAGAVMRHGVELGLEAWSGFLEAVGWVGNEPDRVVCHQVGVHHRQGILQALGLPEAKDFSTFEYLGNVGTVSLPLTAALASERGLLRPGQRVAFLGIGSGLNCLMLGWDW